MIRIAQEHGMGCGAACLAMLTGRSYQEVCDELPEHQWNHEGISMHTTDVLLSNWGYAVARRWGKQNEDWRPEPFSDMHLCMVEVAGMGSHWVVMDGNGVVIDPAFPNNHSLYDYSRVFNVAAVVPITHEDGQGLSDE